MFQFYLVKDHRFTLTWQLAQVDPSSPYLMRRKLTLSPVEIQSTDNPQLCAQLKELMEKGVDAVGSGTSGPEAKLNWTLKVEIGVFPNHSHMSDYIRVWGTKEGNMLTRLKNVMDNYGLETKIKVEIKKFGYSGSSLMTGDVGILELATEMCHLLDITRLHCTGSWDKTQWDHTNPQKRHDFGGVITITSLAFRKNCGALFNLLSEPDTSDMEEVKPYGVRKILKEGLDNDATIIASDGKEIKCHKLMLKGQSDVFEAMFNPASKSLESTTGIIQMKDMCSKSVQAFLTFLYLDDLEDAKGDSAVAVDLLKAAHKYNVAQLEKQMTQVLLMKPNKWFKMKVAIQLFIFARNIPGGNTLKMKATAALKADQSNLWGSSVCKQMFHENPDAAMELSQYLAFGGPVAAGSSAGGSEAKSKNRKMNS